MSRTSLAVVVSITLIAPLAAQWGPVVTSNAPAERAGALLAFDLFQNRTLLFGGNATNELWSLQNGTWTQLQPTVLPSPRARACLATDTLGGQILLYGGDAGARLADDETWQWNGTAWTLLAPATSPGGLARHSMAFDQARQTTVLFGGRHDSWIPNMLSAQTWEFQSGTWTLAAPLASPGPLADAAMCNHPGLNTVLLFGGRDSSGTALDGTWSYDGVLWTQLNTTGVRPPARVGAQMVPILHRGICVLFGGRDPVTMQIMNDTWEHDGVNWTQINNVYGGIYPARAEFGMAHDLLRDRLVVFGGVIANNALQNDTWEYGAQFTNFGNGCPGSAGVPLLTGIALPRLGTTCSAQLTHLHPQSAVAMVAVGLSRTQGVLGNLPVLLTGFGMPSCRSYTSADVFTAIGASGGSAAWSWNVPLVPGFLGQPFHLQGLSIDPGVNAAGLTVSNAATMVIGN